MTIYLHVCCGDCLLRYLTATGYPLPTSLQEYVRNYTDLPVKTDTLPQYHLLYANSNIYPKTEYEARLRVVRSLATSLGFPLQVLDYRPHDYFSLPTSQAQFTSPTRLAARCAACQQLRLHTTLEYIRLHTPENINFSTTMLASRYLDRRQITAIAASLAQKSNTTFAAPTFLTDPDQLRTGGYYKQNYCGCFFSLTEITKNKYF